MPFAAAGLIQSWIQRVDGGEEGGLYPSSDDNAKRRIDVIEMRVTTA